MTNFIEAFTTDGYPAIIAIVCIPFIAGILAIAFPILSGQKNAIKTKYSSETIASLFNKEYRYRMFKYALPLSLIFLLVYLLHIPRIDTGFEKFNTLLDYSAILLLFLSSINLVFSLFGMMNVIGLYDSPVDLLKYYKTKYNKDKNEKWIIAISEIFYFSIRQDEIVLQNEALEFISGIFDEDQKRNEKYQVEYPIVYYEIIGKADDILIGKQKEKPFSNLGGGLMLELLIANYQNIYFSENTFSVIWREIRKAVFYENDKMIYSYWVYAHQFMSYQFSNNQHNFVDLEENEVDNEVIKEHKERFKEFHYMVGALLLYSKRYELLERIIYFTQTTPATYKLVPNSIRELLSEYLDIKNDWGSPMHYRTRYSFPDNSGVDANDVLVLWLEKYFSILFLRQYNIYDNYKSLPYSLQLSDLPDLPANVRELKYWKDRINQLKEFVISYQTRDSEVIKILEFDSFLHKRKYVERHQTDPEKLLDMYISAIEQNIPIVEKEREINPEHLNKFKESTLRIIDRTIKRIQPLIVSTKVEETNIPYASYIGNSDCLIMNKGAWTNDDWNINYDTILAEKVARDIEYYFSMSFVSLSKSRIYKLPGLNVFDAIKKLEIKEKEEYIIASIGFHFEYYMHLDQYCGDFSHVEGNTCKFTDIDVIDIGYAGLPIIGQSLFVLKKSDLPELRKHDLSQQIKEKYKLEVIGDPNEKNYYSVVDLYRNGGLRAEIALNYRGGEDLEKSVLVYIGLSYELRWNKGVSCIQIKSQDNADSLTDVLPINDAM